MEKIFAKIETYLLYVVVFLFPITVLAISPNPFIVPKLAVLAFGVALILLVHSLRVISSGKLDFFIADFDFPVLLLGLAYFLSALLRTPNKMDAFLLPGTATAFVGGALLYYIINQHKEQEKNTIAKLLFGSAAVFSALSLLSFSGLFSKVPQLPVFLRAQGFTPEGGYLPSLIFLIVTLPLGLGQIFSEKEMPKKALLGVSTAIVILGLSISLYNVLPGRTFSPRFPSYGTGWSVAIDALKESPIFGAGAGNYITAFTRFRPISYNQTELWAVKFATARDFYLTTMTEAGMLGVAGLLLLLLAVYRGAKKDFKQTSLVNWGFVGKASLFSLVLLVLAFFFAPATALLIVTLFILLSLNSETKHTSLNLTTQGPEGEVHIAGVSNIATRFPALLITIPVIVLVALFSFKAFNVLRAEYVFKIALDKLVKNDASGTYDTMREAINLNPKVDRYHATFARVNLALANAIAQKAAGSERPEGVEGQPVGSEPAEGKITDQDRQNITLLVQQAINEGKATVALNPLRAGNWEILAQVYRSIMPLAQGADTFTIQTYRQAVALDPLNPNLRIALGGVHYALGDFDSAARVFELATAAKPDHANAHYNLAIALRDKGELDRAIAEMSLVLSLVDQQSQDYQVARKTLEDIQSKKGAAVAGASSELTPPQPGEEAVIQPPINLPEGSEPPAAPITVTPTPVEGEEARPTLTITPTPGL